jgi:hypothetical protein
VLRPLLGIPVASEAKGAEAGDRPSLIGVDHPSPPTLTPT